MVRGLKRDNLYYQRSDQKDKVDGDEINMSLLLDLLLVEEYEVLKPFYNIPDLTKPFAISGNLSLLGPSNAILGNYLMDRREFPEEDTITRMLNFVELPKQLEVV